MICGNCCIAPKAAPYAHANIAVVTSVVLIKAGEKSSAMLGRLRVPACFFSIHFGDSGKNGRMISSGIAGISPDISV